MVAHFSFNHTSIMKKLLFLLPFCVAAAAAVEPQTQTVTYKPIEGTNNDFNKPKDRTAERTGTWTNRSTQETADVSYRPTARDDKEQLFPVDDNAIEFNSAEDTLYTEDIQWSHLAITYTMPKALTCGAGAEIGFSYKVIIPAEYDCSGLLTVSFVDNIANDAFTTGCGKDGVGLTTGVGLHNYYDSSANLALKNSAQQAFTLPSSGPVEFVGSLVGNADGSCTLTLGTGEYSTTTTLGYSFTLSSINISMDGGMNEDLKRKVYAPDLSELTITYKTTTPEPATATLSLLALAGLAARRRRK